MKRFSHGIAAVVIALAFGACSTVINTTTQNVELKTTPPNAKITVDGKSFGTSPQTVNIERGKNHVVRFDLDGYDLYEMQITRKISAWYWFNGLNLFIPGMVADWMTGSMYYLLPDQIEAELTLKKEEEPKKRR
ncbi:MAG: PEGA domain-containing protein [Melioribacteraceae bacterium]|nr:PEGA domain-containing protein [Melioribacteraceae bacterium]MCF8355071.1 PEGA domain-containing protein [Melioribacteraceae bacterium]MCF8395664.1 PEGA domain-containing protein [Melioribacteraceae bacterium]MCF8420289.1 PEGA domain-containing protein [Melioribacteraceae bacterium]